MSGRRIRISYLGTNLITRCKRCLTELFILRLRRQTKSSPLARLCQHRRRPSASLRLAAAVGAHRRLRGSSCSAV